MRDFPEILNLLEGHEIGYHSSSHSVHPNIFEYTDVENYDVAYKASLERECSRINPLTGKIEGPGGFLLLKEVFPKKKIVAFRAPGFCWSPPHLDALSDMGFQFDFSASLSRVPVSYKNVTFYPFPAGGYRFSSFASWGSLITYRCSVLMSHPRNLVKRFGDKECGDLIYYEGNPVNLWQVNSRSWEENHIACNGLSFS